MMLLLVFFLLVASASAGDLEDNNEEASKGSVEVNNPVKFTRDTVSNNAVLGTLYNGKTDQFYISKSLWMPETIENKRRTISKQSSDTKIGYGRKRTAKMDKMDIHASLQLSILGGMITVDGSAQFFHETNVNKNEEVINMYYKGTTRTEVMPAHVKSDIDGACNDKEATHVVSSVTYGLNAYFQFKTKKDDENTTQTIYGDVTASFKRVVLKITGSASVNITEQEKHLKENTDVVFRGDILLKETPTDYESAKRAYKIITSRLIDKPDDAQVVSVVLSPIKDYCHDADRKLNQVGQKVMKALLSVFNDIEDMQMEIGALLQRPISKAFLSLRNNLEKYSEKLLEHQSNFANDLKKILPAVRGGERGEDKLMNLYDDHIKSAFSKINARNFVEARTREANALESLLKVVKSETDNVVKMDYLKANDVVIGLTADRYLTLSINIMDPLVTERFLETKKIDEIRAWYDDTILKETIRSSLMPFKEFARANKDKKGELAYLIKVNKKLASKNSDLALVESRKNTEFQIPDAPDRFILKSVLYNSVTFTSGKAQENNWITKYQINYKNLNSNATMTKTFSLSNKLFVVKELDPNTLYRFTLHYWTDYGISAESKAIKVVTKPSSPPTNLQLVGKTETSLTIEWNEPISIGKLDGKELPITYEVQIKGNQKTTRTEKNISATRFEILQLQLASKYEIAVAASVLPENATKAILSEATSQVFYTSPDRPQLTVVGQAKLTSVELSWNTPKTAPGDEVQKYEIRYVMMNGYGNETLPGTTGKLIYTTEVTMKVADLVPGTYYMFQVRAISKYGRSSYSNAVTDKTTFEQTQLDRLKSDFQQLLSSSEKRLKTELKKEMDSNKELLNAEIVSSQGITQKSLDKLDKETTKLMNKNSELQKKIDKIFGSNMKIKQSVLPAGYDQFSIYDIQWQSLHMAAAAACFGSSDYVQRQYGSYINNVVAQYPGESCAETCYKHSSSECLAQVSILGEMGAKQGSADVVGQYYRYSCNDALKHGEVEHEIDEKKIVDTGKFVMFCCCKGTF